MVLPLPIKCLMDCNFHFCMSRGREEESSPFYLQPPPCTVQKIRPEENLQFLFCLRMFMHDVRNILKKKLIGSKIE